MSIFDRSDDYDYYDGEITRLNNEIRRLHNAIREHRDQRGDDRCWMDDERLYSILPEGLTPKEDRRLHDPCTMLEHCKHYIASRQPGGEPYISVQRELEKLQSDNKRYKEALDKLGVFYQ